MKLLIALWLLLFPVIVFAAPFIVSDDSTTPVTSCEFDGMPIPCTLDGKHISVDAANIALTSGTYTLKAKYCVLEGTVSWCSDWSLPFTFTKPAVPVPAGIRAQSLK